MKRIAFLAAGAATLCTVACNKNMDVPATAGNETSSVQESVPCTVTLGVKGAAFTKSTSNSGTYLQLNSLQALVFHDGFLEGYAKTEVDIFNDINSIDSEISVNCSSGERQVYLAVNCPDLSAVTTEAGLLAFTVNLSQDNNDNGRMMIGSDTVTLPAAETVSIEVHRLISRVVIKKITRAFTVSSAAAKQLKVTGIYLTNVAGITNLGSSMAPTTWYNKQAYNSELSDFTHDSLNQLLANNASYSTTHYFLPYPNPTVDDTSAAEWSPRHTRLVVEVQFDNSDTYYYPITLPVLEANKSYEIEELILTRLGSENPDTPITIQDCAFEFTVKDWSTVVVSDEGEDDITI